MIIQEGVIKEYKNPYLDYKKNIINIASRYLNDKIYHNDKNSNSAEGEVFSFQILNRQVFSDTKFDILAKSNSYDFNNQEYKNIQYLLNEIGLDIHVSFKYYFTVEKSLKENDFFGFLKNKVTEVFIECNIVFDGITYMIYENVKEDLSGLKKLKFIEKEILKKIKLSEFYLNFEQDFESFKKEADIFVLLSY